MRISDWSSDVCSSDLKQRERLTKTLINAVGESRRWPLHQFLPCDSPTARVPSERLQAGISPVFCGGGDRATGAAAIPDRAHAIAQARLDLTIGTATCRAMVRQSKLSTVVAVTVNTE